MYKHATKLIIIRKHTAANDRYQIVMVSIRINDVFEAKILRHKVYDHIHNMTIK